VTVHPQYILDDKQTRQSVILPIEEWERIVEELEELDDIRAYEQAKTEPQECVPFEQAVREKEIRDLFDELCNQPEIEFPQPHEQLTAPRQPGVYISRKKKTVLHVGRTLRAQNGLRQRLNNHLHGESSFTAKYLHGNGARLREKGYTFQYLIVQKPRLRALLEAHAIGALCPRHIGSGEKALSRLNV
jgi:hypothetical protein